MIVEQGLKGHPGGTFGNGTASAHPVDRARLNPR